MLSTWNVNSLTSTKLHLSPVAAGVKAERGKCLNVCVCDYVSVCVFTFTYSDDGMMYEEHSPFHLLQLSLRAHVCQYGGEGR